MKLTKRQISVFGSILLCLLVVFAATNLATIWPDRFGNPTESDTTVTNVADRQPIPAMRIKQVDSFVRTIAHTGQVQTANHTMVAFQRDGLVKELLVDEGQRVKAGQELAILDSRLLSAQLETLDARLLQAQAVMDELESGPRQETKDAAESAVKDLESQVDAQRKRLERSQALLKTNSIATQDHERELHALDGLEARLASARSQRDELNAGTREEQKQAQRALVKSIEAEKQAVLYSLDDCKLTAPFAGMIVNRYFDPGAVVTAGSPIFELIDDQNLEIHVGVPQSLASRLTTGSQCHIALANQIDPEPNSGKTPTKPTGQVRTILPVLDANTRTARVIIDVVDLGDYGSGFFTGQVVNVEFFQTVRDQGFWIPRLALTPDHGGLWSCMMVQGNENGGQAVKQSVEILHQREDWVFVRGTLKDGQVILKDQDLIVAQGLTRFVEDQQIDIQITDSIPPTYLSTRQTAFEETIGE